MGNETWSIPLDGNALPAYIAVQAPENKSGSTDVQLIIYSGEEGETPTETTRDFTLTVNPVADGVTINPTSSVGVADSDVAINLNPTMTDIDGSETATITLADFGVGNNVTFNAGTASYDEGSDTYTITGITHAELGSLTFNTQYNVSETITVTAKTVETGNNNTSNIKTATFNVSVTGGINYMPPPDPPAAPSQRGAASEDNATILHGTDKDDTLDGGAGADKIYGGLGDDTIIFDIKDVIIDGGKGEDTLQVADDIDFTRLGTDLIVDMEIIDLSGNGQQTITLDATSVQNMTDDKNTLLINGDTDDSNEDTVTISGWTQGTDSETIGDTTYNVFTDNTNSATIKVQQGITVDTGSTAAPAAPAPKPAQPERGGEVSEEQPAVAAPQEDRQEEITVEDATDNTGTPANTADSEVQQDDALTETSSNPPQDTSSNSDEEKSGAESVQEENQTQETTAGAETTENSSQAAGSEAETTGNTAQAAESSTETGAKENSPQTAMEQGNAPETPQPQGSEAAGGAERSVGHISVPPVIFEERGHAPIDDPTNHIA